MPHEDEDVDQPGSHVKDTSEEVKGGDIENGLQEPLLGPDERVEDVEIEGGDDTKEGAIKQASFFDLFFFADKVDWMLMAVGTLCAAGAGVIMPLFSIVFGDILDAFHGPDPTKQVNKNAIYFVYLAVVSFFLNGGLNVLFAMSSERQIRRMRMTYLSSALRQEIGWFDTTKPGELTTRIKADTLVVRDGIGIKLARLIQFTSMFVSGFVIGFVRGWELALVMLCVVPPLAVAGTVMFKKLGSLATLTQKSTAAAGGVAEEAISSIRTVAAFTGERKEAARYEEKVDEATETSVAAGVGIGRAFGVMMFIIFCSYGLGMWYGASEVARDIRRGCLGEGCKTGGEVLTVFWAILNGAMSIGQMAPNLQSVAEARGAAGHLLAVCRRKAAIDSCSKQGIVPATKDVQGKVEFRDVHFTYPSRPKDEVFKGFNLEVDPGTTVALVGASGAGKSTVVSLLERFYDPDEGVVTLDGVDVRALNIQWLRSQLGLVSQEPVLFSQSIGKNIACGREGATKEQIEEAARKANAYDFIMGFPDGFDTEVGERGVQLSGGQKQRVAIARAVLKNPAVLLLDEATSALDVESERVVQEALDRLLEMKQGTTIVIAHRLSTIRNADKICVVEDGRIVETGKHDELIEIDGGKYLKLVKLQLGGGTDEDDIIAVGDDDDDGVGGGEMLVPTTGSDRGDRRASSSMIRQSSMTSTLHGEDEYDPLLKADGAVSGSSLLACSLWSDCRGDTLTLRWSHLNGCLSALGAKLPKVARGRLWALSRPERKWLMVAIVACTFSGTVFPLFSLMLSTIISFFYLDDADELERKASLWSLLFVVLASVVGVSFFVQVSSFSQMGARLTGRLQKVTFRAIVRQDVGWFDKEENSTGALTARLATEATLIKNITGQNLGRMYQNAITITSAFLIAFVFGSPLLSVVLAAIMPVLILAGYLQIKVVTKSTTSSQDSVAKAGKVAVQAIDGVRTVAAFNLTEQVMVIYNVELKAALMEGLKRGVTDGLALGISQLITIGAYGFVFWWGGHRVIDGNMDFTRMLKSLMAVMMAAQGVGQTTSFLGDSAAANAAASRIFAIVDRKPAINSADESGQRLPAIKGKIELRKVRFRYPARPEALVFRNLKLKIEPGTTVALVGSSGSGKSTVINLLLRFYDPEMGGVLLDGSDVRTLNLVWLREQIGLVSQEPVLFATTIADNIAYGREGATREEIEEAARKANAHDFVTSFPDGYDTEVGDKGVQLSGGQKQRIAIARAILKDPAILLLDEATSALDMESERLVQAALDKLVAEGRRGRTTIVIAHRLSTVRKSDKICVVHHGAVVEEGSHEQLLAKSDSRYKILVDAAEGRGGTIMG
ncbi:unnamed protein product [Ascophyllum nodosum]